MYLRKILLIILLVISSSAHSVTVYGNISGGKLQWSSAIVIGDNIKPAQWSLSGNIQPGKSFYQDYIQATSDSIVFTNTSAANVTLTTGFSLSGAEYISPYYNFLASMGGNAETTNNGKYILVDGVGNGNMMVSLSKSITPFTHYRPVFNLPNILNDFKNKPSGLYTGSVSVLFSYVYVKDNDVHVRNTIMAKLNFAIEHSASVVNSVNFDSASKGMDVTYKIDSKDESANAVSGSVEFIGSVRGFFPNGVNIKAVSSINNFNLSNMQSYNIPYNVECRSCDVPILVLNGIPTAPGSNTIALPVNETEVGVNIRVFFDDHPLQDLVAGDFTDTFTLMFTPKM